MGKREGRRVGELCPVEGRGKWEGNSRGGDRRDKGWGGEKVGMGGSGNSDLWLGVAT